MDYYAAANGIVAGICLGFGIIFLFVGLRRKNNKRLNLLFALFALAYAATLFNGIRFHNATSVEQYVGLARWDAIPVVLAFTALIWYVAEYTKVRPRIFLWGLTALFIVTGLAQIVRVNLLYEEILGLNMVMMPWREQVAYLEATDSIWSLLFLGAQLAVLVFMVYACIRQYLRGERREALILSIGALWFVATIAAELLGQAGLITPVFYGEFGFLGFVVAISLQMSSEIIETEEQLADYRLNLENLVNERTSELEESQSKLLQQTQEQATIEERSRLARDLHDAVTQTIYSAALISEALPQVWEKNPSEGLRNLTKLRQLVRGALAEMRSLLFELRPSSLEAADLGTLLRQLGDSLTGRTQIPVTVDIQLEDDLPPEVKVAYYRISQEALNNIEKHARADSVEVALHRSSGQVMLTVQDNGRGFDPDALPADRMGRLSMEERAAGIGAHLDIDSRPGYGTVVKLTWVRDEAE
ncbi:MAG: sensor histidine kinase [Candidatus Promineifilaceae bacterium]